MLCVCVEMVVRVCAVVCVVCCFFVCVHVVCGVGVVCVGACGVVWCVVKLGTRKTSLCVRSKDLRVYGQDVSVCTGNRPACLRHAGPLPVHTETS